MDCPDCGHKNIAGALLCANCGADLYDMLLEKVTTKQLEKDDKNTTNRLRLGEPETSRPVLLYIGANQNISISIERRDDLSIGRVDPDTGESADIDLTDYDAQNLGVSRRHAIMNAASNKPTITDLGSFNGTYVNGQRLRPQQPYQLESGDEVRLGRLNTRVYYK